MNQHSLLTRPWNGSASRFLRMAFILLLLSATPCLDRSIQWIHLTSKNGDLPVPGTSTQQTGLVVAKLDNSGATGFVVSFRVTGPALVWYRRAADGWKRYVIEKEFLTVEAGGAAYDIDGDGNLDIFAAEMAKWTNKPQPDYPQATAWILYGDGKGHFKKTILVKGEGWHEGKLADVDGNGNLDIINKPYTWDAPRIDLWLNNGTGTRSSQTGREVPCRGKA